MIFKNIKSSSSHHNEQSRHRQRDLAVKRQLPETPEFLGPNVLQYPQYIPPDDIAQSSQYDQQHRHQIDHGLEYITTQAVLGHNIHSCITECGNGIEDRDPDAPRAIFRYKYRHIQECTGSFHHQRSYEDLPEEFHDSGNIIQIECILQKSPVADAQSSVQSHHDTVHYGNDSQAPQLNEDQNHNLSPDAPGGIRRHCYKAGHTDGCGSRK